MTIKNIKERRTQRSAVNSTLQIQRQSPANQLSLLPLAHLQMQLKLQRQGNAQSQQLLQVKPNMKSSTASKSSFMQKIAQIGPEAKNL